MISVSAAVLNVSIIQNIQDYIPQRFSDWEALYGKFCIYQTDHYITYGGGPEGGYVIFYREQQAGWYYWNKDWHGKPEYTKIDEGIVAFRIDEDGCEFVAVVPDMWQQEQDEDEVIIIGDDEEMQGRDRGDY